MESHARAEVDEPEGFASVVADGPAALEVSSPGSDAAVVAAREPEGPESEFDALVSKPHPVSDGQPEPEDPVVALVRQQRKTFVRKRLAYTGAAALAVAGFCLVMSVSLWAAFIVFSFFLLVFILVPSFALVAPIVSDVLGHVRVYRARKRLGPAGASIDRSHLSKRLRVLVLDARNLLLAVEDPDMRDREIERLVWDFRRRLDRLPEPDRVWLEMGGARLSHTLELARGQRVKLHRETLGRELSAWVEICETPRQQSYR